MELRSSIDLATIPAHAADAIAATSIARRRQSRLQREDLVRQAVREQCGTEMRGPFIYRTSKLPSGAYYIAAVHTFSAPEIAEAEFSIVAHRFPFTRRAIEVLATWLLCDTGGVQRLWARIPVEDRDVEDLAQRAGFRFSHTDRLDDGRITNCWSLTPPQVFDIGRRTR